MGHSKCYKGREGNIEKQDKRLNKSVFAAGWLNQQYVYDIQKIVMAKLIKGSAEILNNPERGML